MNQWVANAEKLDKEKYDQFQELYGRGEQQLL